MYFLRFFSFIRRRSSLSYLSSSSSLQVFASLILRSPVGTAPQGRRGLRLRGPLPRPSPWYHSRGCACGQVVLWAPLIRPEVSPQRAYRGVQQGWILRSVCEIDGALSRCILLEGAVYPHHDVHYPAFSTLSPGAFLDEQRCSQAGQGALPAPHPSLSRRRRLQFMCEDGSGDYIARVDEPQSCTYVLTIHTTRICNHPFLRPPSTGTPQPIKCHPALSPEQYVEYVKAQVYDTKRIVEELSEELKTLDLKTLASKSAGSLDDGKPVKTTETNDEHQQVETGSEFPQETESTEDETAVNLEQEEAEADLWNKIVQPRGSDTQDADTPEETIPSLSAPDGRTAGSSRTPRYRIIKNPEDLVKFIADLKKTHKKDDKSDAEKELHSEDESSPESDIRDPEDEDERALMQEFEKELENILLPKSDASQIKENVKAEMEKEFDNIIDEAQEELETEGLKGEFDRKQASKSLATTLNKLIDKLDSTAAEKEEEIPAAESDEATTNDDYSDPAAKAPTDDRSDGRVKVRVTKIRRGSSEHPESKEMSSENPQLRHIENVVKDLLEKEGLKAEGKIEIKILTGGFGDDDDGHWLSEEDTRNLKDIFFNILIQGSEDAHKEQKRQQQLEDNYRFVWNQNSDDSKSSSTSTDSEDVDF
ncbi:protein OS-9 isoform 2-T2 [Anomaloglossus baeobatrachus]|uniref:protein OS-9 isoform X2 n=1 Tax=Anomaloglossus baeobatrachus TaxID=238106 RepID=UPI003F500857